MNGLFVCVRARRALRRGFSGEPLSPALQHAVWNHLRRCEACRAEHALLVRVERLLASNGRSADEPCARELEVFADRAVVPATPPRAAVVPWLGAAFAVAAGLLLVLWARRAPEPEFQVRSGETVDFAVKTFCQWAAPDGGEQLDVVEADGATCPKHGVVTFAYRSSAPVQVLAWWKAGATATSLGRAPLGPSSALTPLPFEVPMSLGAEEVVLAVVDGDAPAEASLESLPAERVRLLVRRPMPRVMGE